MTKPMTSKRRRARKRGFLALEEMWIILAMAIPFFLVLGATAKRTVYENYKSMKTTMAKPTP